MENNNQPKIVKRIEPAICPHCKKEILIGTQTMITPIISLSTADDIKEAKKNITDRLKEITFSEPNDLKEVLKWLNEESTLLDKSDIEPLLKQIATEQLNKNEK